MLFTFKANVPVIRYGADEELVELIRSSIFSFSVTTTKDRHMVKKLSIDIVQELR